MPLKKLLSFTKDVGDFVDKPNGTMSATEVKAQFDAAPNEVRVYLNQMIDGLASVVDGDSGADNIGATAIAGLTGETVQELLESLRTLDDTNRAYLLSQINGLILGQISDEAITQSKFSTSNTSVVRFVVDTGTANAKVVTLNPAPTAYVEGMAIAFKNLIENTSDVSININGLGTKSILKSNGSALTTGNLKVNSVYTLRYNGTFFILQGEGGEYGTAVAGDVLTGMTIGTDAGIVNGTLSLTGTAVDADVLTGKTYYNTDVKTKRTGTLIPGKKFATGTGTFNGSNQLVVTGLNFAPRMVTVNAPSISAYGYIFKDISTTSMLMNNNGAMGVLASQVLGATNFTVQGTSTLFGTAVATWWAWE